MTRRGKRTFRDAEAQAHAVKQVMSPRRLTCEGCAGLRIYPRPMCREERSPHFRTARDTYHERCAWFSVGLATVEDTRPANTDAEYAPCRPAT